MRILCIITSGVVVHAFGPFDAFHLFQNVQTKNAWYLDGHPLPSPDPELFVGLARSYLSGQKLRFQYTISLDEHNCWTAALTPWWVLAAWSTADFPAVGACHLDASFFILATVRPRCVGNRWLFRCQPLLQAGGLGGYPLYSNRFIWAFIGSLTGGAQQ